MFHNVRKDVVINSIVNELGIVNRNIIFENMKVSEIPIKLMNIISSLWHNRLKPALDKINLECLHQSLNKVIDSIPHSLRYASKKVMRSDIACILSYK